MPNNISKTIKVMSKLLDAIIEEGKRLKASGWEPKFRGDTGINVCQVMIDSKFKSRNEWDIAFVETFKEINKNKQCQ
jgi:hypothetical protein|tara:strand:- start:422 stop:652 length:231 start_codon:yes stop_codon:yes gene_type:complete